MMNAYGQNQFDFKEMNTVTFNFFKKTSQPWMDLFSRSFAKFKDTGKNATPMNAADMIKMYFPIHTGALMGINGQKSALQKMLTAYLEQQKLYSNLTASGLACATKTMEAIRAGVQMSNDSPEKFSICQDLAEDYSRSCANFIEHQYAQAFRYMERQDDKEDKAPKTESVKSKAEAKPLN